MEALSIITRRDRPDDFAAWMTTAAFAVGERHPIFGSFGRSFYPATYDTAIDMSFAITRNQEPLLLVMCNLLDGILGNFGQPMILLPRETISEAAHSAAIVAALSALNGIAKAARATAVLLREDVIGSTLSTLGRGCLARQGAPQVKLHGFCDLTWDEPRFRRSLRKSYQSLVNWGRRNLRISYVNASNPDRDLFDAYRKLHAHVVGRVTRSPASWEPMFQWIAAGEGELALAYLTDGCLVAGTMSIDGSEITYYTSGAYDRERFHQPLAHLPLYDAILRSRGRGMRYYDLGELPAKQAASDKEFNIGYFKRGFATSIEMHLVWRWEIAAQLDPGTSRHHEHNEEMA